jgi:hypothetical protein
MFSTESIITILFGVTLLVLIIILYMHQKTNSDNITNLQNTSDNQKNILSTVQNILNGVGLTLENIQAGNINLGNIRLGGKTGTVTLTSTNPVEVINYVSLAGLYLLIIYSSQENSSGQSPYTYYWIGIVTSDNNAQTVPISTRGLRVGSMSANSGSHMGEIESELTVVCTDGTNDIQPRFPVLNLKYNIIKLE